MRLFRDYTPLQVGALLLAVSATVLADEPLTFQGVSEDELLQAEGNWGGMSGQIIFDGKLPERKLLIRKDAEVKDAAICSAVDHFDESFLVDRGVKGIENCFVYLYRCRKNAIHPLLSASATQNVRCDIRSCRFRPRNLVVQAGQPLNIFNLDAVEHNAHCFPLRNHSPGFSLFRNTARGRCLQLKFLRSEGVPIAVKCDIHSWMRANLLVLDHPYAVVTDKGGRFRIVGLPVGKHRFHVWHERIGYIDREFTLTVADGDVTDAPPLKVAADRFEQ